MTIVIPLSTLPGKTYLQLCQRLRQEVEASGTGPTTVLNQTGEYKRLVDWIAEADEEIQREYDEWKFMVNTYQINTVVGLASYYPSDCVTPITDLRKWKERRPKCYLLSAGVTDEQEMTYIDYEDWYRKYGTGPQSNSRPIHWTYGNYGELLIGPQPGDVYRISGEYQRVITTLATDDQTPIYPAEFHMLPVYLAMMRYGRYTAAPEVYSDGERLYNKMKSQMIRTQMPRLNRLLPLA